MFVFENALVCCFFINRWRMEKEEKAKTEEDDSSSNNQELDTCRGHRAVSECCKAKTKAINFS